ncbi:MAG: TetR family transcriptional regulator [Marinobacter sp.]|uniref:TetR family transcriptional regulator n=1 Tax=Marinobacter sp. TaxID=50741 RepID=UPI002653EA9A|nr:TetR family transcriptional regulator [Marinobacter sp.]
MARRTKEEARQTREQLIDAAEIVFHRKGVAQTSLNDIAKEAKLTRGAIYWHFKNKQDIFKAMLDRQTLTFEQINPALEASGEEDSLARLQQSILHVIHDIEHNPHRRLVYEIIFQKCEITAQNEPIGSLLKENALIGSERMREAFNTAVQNRKLPQNLDTDSAITHLQVQVTGMVYLWLLMPEKFHLQREASHSIQLFFEQLPTQFLRSAE